MKYVLSLAVLAAAVMGNGATASAQQGRVVRQERARPLERLVEMERNKNAWLRATFFGR